MVGQSWKWLGAQCICFQIPKWGVLVAGIWLFPGGTAGDYPPFKKKQEQAKFWMFFSIYKRKGEKISPSVCSLSRLWRTWPWCAQTWKLPQKHNYKTIGRAEHLWVMSPALQIKAESFYDWIGSIGYWMLYCDWNRFGVFFIRAVCIYIHSLSLVVRHWFVAAQNYSIEYHCSSYSFSTSLFFPSLPLPFFNLKKKKKVEKTITTLIYVNTALIHAGVPAVT